mmetsp:Transcript_24967/g.53940  ORF Transcript_24967/g.53940 Transcript_24967/m.53940 type:complete len:206 (-) Transcript_24967:469-1086(-)
MGHGSLGANALIRVGGRRNHQSHFQSSPAQPARLHLDGPFAHPVRHFHGECYAEDDNADSTQRHVLEPDAADALHSRLGRSRPLHVRSPQARPRHLRARGPRLRRALCGLLANRSAIRLWLLRQDAAHLGHRRGSCRARLPREAHAAPLLGLLVDGCSVCLLRLGRHQRAHMEVQAQRACDRASCSRKEKARVFRRTRREAQAPA